MSFNKKPFLYLPEFGLFGELSGFSNFDLKSLIELTRNKNKFNKWWDPGDWLGCDAAIAYYQTVCEQRDFTWDIENNEAHMAAYERWLKLRRQAYLSMLVKCYRWEEWAPAATRNWWEDL